MQESKDSESVIYTFSAAFKSLCMTDPFNDEEAVYPTLECEMILQDNILRPMRQWNFWKGKEDGRPVIMNILNLESYLLRHRNVTTRIYPSLPGEVLFVVLPVTQMDMFSGLIPPLQEGEHVLLYYAATFCRMLWLAADELCDLAYQMFAKCNTEYHYMLSSAMELYTALDDKTNTTEFEKSLMIGEMKSFRRQWELSLTSIVVNVYGQARFERLYQPGNEPYLDPAIDHTRSYGGKAVIVKYKQGQTVEVVQKLARYSFDDFPAIRGQRPKSPPGPSPPNDAVLRW